MSVYEETQAILNTYKIQANKSLGQNFLIDDNVVNEIVEGSNVNVNLAFKGKALLDGKNFNIVLSELIKNIYGENYKIQFVENISEEKLKEYQAHLESLEEQVVNIAKAGYFSSDRTIEEYNRDIWKLEQ